MQPDAGPAELPAQPKVPGPARLESEALGPALESEAPGPALLESPTQGPCYLEHTVENTFNHVLQEINKPAPPQLVQGVLERLKAIRRSYYSYSEKTLQSCIHNLLAVGGPPLLHVLTAGGVLLKHTQGHEEAITDLLVDKQLEEQSKTSTVAAGRVLERVSELTDVPSTFIIVRRERVNSILVEDPAESATFEQVKAGTGACASYSQSQVQPPTAS